MKKGIRYFKVKKKRKTGCTLTWVWTDLQNFDIFMSSRPTVAVIRILYTVFNTENLEGSTS